LTLLTALAFLTLSLCLLLTLRAPRRRTKNRFSENVFLIFSYMFSTTELRVLVGLLDGKTIAQIADELLLTHPSVSKTLRSAQRRAGFPLTEQRGRRLRLTADGTRVAVAAQQVLVELGQLDRLAAEVRAGASGGLRVVATATICNYVLPSVIGGLLSEVADADLRIQAAPGGADVWTMFDSGDYEVAIARDLPPPHIAATHLFDDQLSLCVAPGSDLAGRDIRWADVSGRTLIGPIGEDVMWGQFSLLGIRGRSWVRVSTVPLAKRLVEDGRGVALLYRTVALEEAAAGRIVMLPLPDTPISVSYWMAVRGGLASPLADRFTRLLTEHVARLGPS
jgi:LysR family transcriptional regulator, low CO2-responsive transcriptional regulator